MPLSASQILKIYKVNKDKILVLNKIKENPNIDVRDLYKLINDKIEWNSLLNLFTKIGEEGLIKRDNLSAIITPLGENKLVDLENELNEQNTIKKLTIEELKRNIFQLKYWWVIILINFIISIIVAVLTVMIVNLL
jgi:hypothetical protein